MVGGGNFENAAKLVKLREISGQQAVLIGYARPDQTGARMCNYHLAPVPDAAALKALLSDVLGVRGVVAKRRHVYLWHNVRIHLDDVAGLGQFVEFEAVLSSDETEAASRDRLNRLCRELNISPSDTCSTSYVELLGL